METAGEFFWLLVLVAIPIFGFLPSILAFKNHHPRRWFILGVNFFLGAVGIGWIAGWWIYLAASPFTETGLAPVNSEGHQCPTCERFYDPADYRIDAKEIACSYCGSPLPRAGSS